MKTPRIPQLPKMPKMPKLPRIDRKWIILGGVGLVLLIGLIVFLNLGKEEVVKEKVRVEEAKGPDPRIAKIAGFAKQSEEFEAKGEYKDALWYLDQIAKLDPADPRIAARRPALAEKVKRIEAWEKAQQQAESERKEAQRLNTSAAWKKVLDLAAEADKLADTDKQRAATKPVAAVAKQYHAWASARDEDKKANYVGALDLVGQAIAAGDAPPELTAYKADLEKRKKKQDYDRAASAASKEGVPTKAYELWQTAKSFAEDPKDVAEADARLYALKARVDPAERDRRYAELMKTGDTALAAGELDAAEKAYKEAQGLKGTDLAAGQAINKVNAARRTKDFDAAVAAAKAAEAKKEWADAIDAYDKALRVKPGDMTVTARRKEVEENGRPPKITLMVGEPPDVKMEFLLIKRGKFQMGDASGNSDEKVHEVVIEKDFWMLTTELTQAHWGAVMHSKPWMSMSVPHMPVEGVSWEDTGKFFEKLNVQAKEQLKGRKGGLPTEAEWEYACRAGTTSKYSFGNDESQFDLYGWSAASKIKAPQTVAQKPANAWGLFDMHGNVAEWCADQYAAYGDKPAADSSLRVLRGGNWNERSGNCRSAVRGKEQSTVNNLYIGFRPVVR
jgi:formylglycine-generating enzyme required for sulfatase activity